MMINPVPMLKVARQDTPRPDQRTGQGFSMAGLRKLGVLPTGIRQKS